MKLISMKQSFFNLFLCCLFFSSCAVKAQPSKSGLDNEKAAIITSLEQKQQAYTDIAQNIWNWAELGYQEEKSAGLLQETLKSAGFKVEAGVAEIPTAFVASYGSGEPVIGILGEYDALPGIW